MMKNPIGWFDLPVTDLDRAEKFYHDYFGFDFQRQSEKDGHIGSWFPMDMESYGAAGMLIQGPNYKPSMDGPLIYFTAPEGSITKAIEKAEAQGIKVLVSYYSLGEHGHMAVILDSEGNKIALHSMVE